MSHKNDSMTKGSVTLGANQATEHLHNEKRQCRGDLMQVFKYLIKFSNVDHSSLIELQNSSTTKNNFRAIEAVGRQIQCSTSIGRRDFSVIRHTPVYSSGPRLVPRCQVKWKVYRVLAFSSNPKPFISQCNRIMNMCIFFPKTDNI